MSVLGRELIEHPEEITEAWYQNWKKSPHPHEELSEAALKDHLPVQLRIIGEQLEKMEGAEHPERMWAVIDRLDPEARVLQRIPIEEVVQEYRIAVATVRDWIEKKQLQVPFHEFSYFYESMFELTAESVRRYSAFQAEQVRKDRAEYVAGLAHQMRTPLSVLSGQIGLIEEGLQELNGEAFDRLHRNLNRLIFLTNGVMRLERFKSEDLPVRPERIRLADFIHHIANDNRHEATQKQLQLEISIDPSLEIEADPDLLMDALGNLVQNAVKYTESGFVRVAVVEGTDCIAIEVSDSGPGISSERQKTVFSPMVSAKRGGVGIGLTIVHRAVIAQGGKIEVKSKIGKGTMFSIQFPKKVSARHVDSTLQDPGGLPLAGNA